MQYLILALVFLASSNSFAGLFCGELNCDLSVSKYSSRIEKQDTVTKRTEIIYDSSSPTQAMAEVKPLIENSSIVVFKKMDGVEYRNCKAQTFSARINTDINGSYVEGRYAVDVEVKCTKVSFELKNTKEYQYSLCQKATECASQIKNTDNLKDYIKLKEKMCDENNIDTVTNGDSNVDSSNRSVLKEKERYPNNDVLNSSKTITK